MTLKMRLPHRVHCADTAPAIIATPVLALLVAACSTSGSPPPNGFGGPRHAGERSTSASAVGFSRCMRSHGVRRFPDPVTGDGRLPKISPEILGVSSSQFNAAERACQRLLPHADGMSMEMDSTSVERCIVGGVCLPAVTQWMLNVELRYARCMRSHGEPSWPDPVTDSEGRVNFDLSLSWAASPPEPAHRECTRLTGAPIG